MAPMTPQPPDDDPDPRIFLAAERTLLAWIRTGLALLGFGFVVAKYGLFLREMAIPRGEGASGGDPVTALIGTGMALLGVAVCGLAAWQHAALVTRLSRGEPYQPARSHLGIVVAAVLAALGLGVAVYLLLSTDW